MYVNGSVRLDDDNNDYANDDKLKVVVIFSLT